MNLISNAIKFTDKGRVGIFLTQRYRRAGRVDLIIDVEDTGIGIPKSQHEVIFENFRQQDNQRAKQYGGTGLGLAITKKLVELMGGEISVESEVGKGSVFHIILKQVEIGASCLGKERKPPAKHITEVYFHDASILVVDDVAYNIEVIKNFLQDTGVMVTGATSAQDALDILQDRNFHLILMDLRMPNWDGFSFTRKLREEKRFRNIPIIAVTALSLKDRLNEINELFDGYLLKPIDKTQLLSTLKRFLDYEQRVKSRLKLMDFSFHNLPEEFKKEIKRDIGPMLSSFNGAFEMEVVKNIGERWESIAKKYGFSEISALGNQLLASSRVCDISSIKKIIGKMKKWVL
jgi:CheY-like chemotaxis protein